jgi:hypothetical protein
MHVELMKDSSKRLPLVDGFENASSMRVWYCKYNDFSALSMYSSLRELVIAGYPEKTLGILQGLRHLTYLSIVHLPKVVELKPLSLLHNLCSLSLSTLPSWDSSKRFTIVESLDPIREIVSLRHLELFGIFPADKSLSAIERCRSLLSARFSQFPREVVDKFYTDTGVLNEFNPRPLFESNSPLVPAASAT